MLSNLENQEVDQHTWPFHMAIWMFPKIGVPQNGWFMMENPKKMDDLGAPLFLETPIYVKLLPFGRFFGWFLAQFLHTWKIQVCNVDSLLIAVLGGIWFSSQNFYSWLISLKDFVPLKMLTHKLKYPIEIGGWSHFFRYWQVFFFFRKHHHLVGGASDYPLRKVTSLPSSGCGCDESSVSVIGFLLKNSTFGKMLPEICWDSSCYLCHQNMLFIMSSLGYLSMPFWRMDFCNVCSTVPSNSMDPPSPWSWTVKTP